MAKFLRWMVIYAMGLTTVTIIGRTLLTDEPLEPILLPEYIEPMQNSDTVYIDRISSTDYLDEIITAAQMAEIRTELEIRRTKVKSACEILGNETSPIHAVVSNMIVDTKHGLSWCPIYKAGSSTWMVHFAVLGRTLSDLTVELIERNVLQVNTLARQAFPNADLKSTLEKLKHTKKFIVVRHPFERLLSAYRDKLESMESRKYYYNKYGRHITQRYRQKTATSDTKREPTFTEFLRFIAKEKYFDEHWAPYNQFCRPCVLNYDYILKFETFERDEDFLIQELGLNQYLYTKNNVKNVNPQGATTTMISKKYFQNIPKMLLEEVYRVYEKDFKLFNYSPDGYYHMTTM